jgi:glycosyltransferase involved in cell wall biosynthesis
VLAFSKSSRDTSPTPGRSAEPRQHSVAIFLWGNEIEDFLDNLGVSLSDFYTDFTGSWVFSFAQALRETGLRPVIFFTSRSVRSPEDHVHTLTGIDLCVLPSALPYRALRKTMKDPYGFSVRDMFGSGRLTELLRPLLVPFRATALYLATPPLEFARALRRHQVSTIICQEYEYPRFDVCIAVGKLMRLPVFASFQGGTKHRSRIESLVRRATVNRASGLLIASGSEAQRVCDRYGALESRIFAVPNPIDVTTWYPDKSDGARDELGIDRSALVAVWHGRVSLPNKGLDLLLEAWDRVRSERPEHDLQLLLVGTGESAAELRSLVGEPGARRVIWINEFISDRARLRKLLSVGDVYVFPSRHEGFALAPLEAMACGPPILAAGAPGVRELIGGEGPACARVVPVGDAGALASAIADLFDHPLDRLALGVQARERAVKVFSQQAVGTRLQEILRPDQLPAPAEDYGRANRLQAPR